MTDLLWLLVFGWVALIIWWIYASTKRERQIPISAYAHFVIFKNSKKDHVCEYRLILDGKDITKEFCFPGTFDDRKQSCVTNHLDFEGKFHLGGDARIRLKREPLFHHRVYLDDSNPTVSRGYGSIKTRWHNQSPKKIYEELLYLTAPPPAPTEENRPLIQNKNPTSEEAVLANLCGYHFGTVTYLVPEGASLARGETIAKIEVTLKSSKDSLRLTIPADFALTVEKHLLEIGCMAVEKTPLVLVTRC